MFRLGVICLTALVCAWAAYVFYGFLFLGPAPERTATRPPVTPQETEKIPVLEKVEPQAPEPVTVQEPAPPPPPPVPPAPQEKMSLGGSLEISDKWGQRWTVPCPLVAGGWLALPRRACLGGYSWIYTDTSGNAYGVSGGIWAEGEDVGLWRLDVGAPLPSAELAAWAPERPLSWSSLVSKSALKTVKTTLLWEQGYWLNCRVNGLPDEPGIFIQDNKVVGWSFSPWLEGGYLWNRRDKPAGEEEISVSDFYQLTFAGGREEQFARGLALPDTEPVSSRLAMLAAGFLLPAKLGPGDTPPALRPRPIIQQIYALAKELKASGRGRQLLNLIDSGLLREIMDIDLLLLLADIRAGAHDFTGTDQLLSRARTWPWPDEGKYRLDEAALQLYLLRLNKAVGENDLESGWQLWHEARSKFSDPGLDLYGVELALLGNDRQSAEELLDREWPRELTERVNELTEQLTAQKNLENKIVIHFTPGARRIPVTARLNGSLSLNFLIDTGATSVTIPLSAAEALGLEINKQTPRHKVITAGGEVWAWGVKLEEIELEGWVLSGLEAMVLDIPGQDDLGLLGLNFLNYFVVNLDSDEGVLLLEPK